MSEVTSSGMRSATKRFLNWFGIPPYWLKSNAAEINASAMRIWNLLPVQRRRIRRLLKCSTVRLNIGCGSTLYPGWTGLDQTFSSSAEILLDLRRPMPFPDESVDLCYSEHFLEHLYPEEGSRHLREVFRILKLGGRYRVVVPNVMKFAKCYLENDGDFFRRAFPWAKRPMEALYCIANWNGEHRNMLDFNELEFMGREAGFAIVLESRANESEILDLRIDQNDPQRIEESLYVELVKAV